MNYVIIYETQNREEAIVIESALQSSGIDCRIDQESVAKFYNVMTAGLGNIRIIVPEEDAEKAMKLIESTM